MSDDAKAWNEVHVMLPFLAIMVYLSPLLCTGLEEKTFLFANVLLFTFCCSAVSGKFWLEQWNSDVGPIFEIGNELGSLSGDGGPYN